MKFIQIGNSITVESNGTFGFSLKDVIAYNLYVITSNDPRIQSLWMNIHFRSGMAKGFEVNLQLEQGQDSGFVKLFNRGLLHSTLKFAFI